MTRRYEQPKKKNFIWGIGLILVIGGGLYLFLFSGFFNIGFILVENNSFYSETDIIEKTKVQYGTNQFKVKLSEVRDNLLNDPYIKGVTIDRKLPDKLVIQIVERKESACIEFMGKWLIIDEEGYALRIADTLPEYSILDGFTIIDFTVGDKIQVKEEDELYPVLKVIQGMNKNNLFFKNVGIKGQEMVLYISDNLTCKGEVDVLLESMDALRDILYDLHKRGVKRGTIHIRGNGYYSYSPLE
ncbi:MAG: FtsQ-type POTRA domain-containing protein [Peptostreptococcales bacterium]